MTVDELIEITFDTFKVSKKSFTVELYSGFPLKLLQVPPPNDEDDKKVFLVQSFIRGGESVTVKFCPRSNAKPASRKRSRSAVVKADGDNETSTSVTAGSHASNTNKRGRPPKRAAATAASASFKDAMKEQDKILRNERETTSNRKIPVVKSGSGATAETLLSKRRAAAEARAAKANSRRLASLPGGRKLNDDGHTSTTAAAPSAKRRGDIVEKSVNSVFKGMKSEDDISFALLSSVNTPGGKKVSKVLRYAMRRTVEKSYEQSRAAVRCSAITSGDITFLPQQNNEQHGTCNQCGTFTVQYPKGIEGIGYFRDEKIHIISIEALRAVVQTVYEADNEEEREGEEHGTKIGFSDGAEGGKEMLKPTNMAQLSPRVFWSLWFYYRDKCSSIEEALEILLPQLNWKFLHTRSRQLSEKARENLRQQEEVKCKIERHEQNKVHKENEYEAGVKAVRSVEEAMEKMYEKDSAESIRARAAKAALDRITKFSSSNHDEWNFETPTELDIDELRECIVEGMKAQDKDEQSEEMIDACAQYLRSICSIYNWRMLANVSCDDLFLRLSQPSSTFSNINENIVAGMITAAQERSIEEIMLEILDGNENVYHVLNEDASSATPRDIILWQLAPSILLEEAPALTGDNLNVSEDNVLNWCKRAQVVMDQLQWLDLYSTSILSS